MPLLAWYMWHPNFPGPDPSPFPSYDKATASYRKDSFFRRIIFPDRLFIRVRNCHRNGRMAASVPPHTQRNTSSLGISVLDGSGAHPRCSQRAVEAGSDDGRGIGAFSPDRMAICRQGWGFTGMKKDRHPLGPFSTNFVEAAVQERVVDPVERCSCTHRSGPHLPSRSS